MQLLTRGYDLNTSCVILRIGLVPFLALVLIASPGWGREYSVASIYPDACLRRGEDYWNYEKVDLSEAGIWQPRERYKVRDYLGDGTSSVVLDGLDRASGTNVAIKVLRRQIQPKRIQREVLALRALGGRSGVIGLLALCSDPNSGRTALILDKVQTGSSWLQHAAWKTPFTSIEIRRFMFKLLQSLDYCHSLGIMHRDIKPGNVLVCRHSGDLRLIDWGLADFYIPGKRFAVRVGTRAYKAPEMLLGFRFYDYAVDIFSAGCILAGLLFRKEPFFAGRNDDDQLHVLAGVLGPQGLQEFVEKYHLKLPPQLRTALVPTHECITWEHYMQRLPDDLRDAQELLNRMLCFDHQRRATAQEALSHPFFDPVRQIISEEDKRKVPSPPYSPLPPPSPSPPPHSSSTLCD